jgi:hypothetical protein
LPFWYLSVGEVNKHVDLIIEIIIITILFLIIITLVFTVTALPIAIIISPIVEHGLLKLQIGIKDESKLLGSPQLSQCLFKDTPGRTKITHPRMVVCQQHPQLATLILVLANGMSQELLWTQFQ